MAIVKRFITYALPEDTDSDQIQLWNSATETGTYTLIQTVNYTYSSRATEFGSLDTTKWYKINFRNSNDGTTGALSDAFPGDGVDSRQPFAAISSTFDGARYATTTEFYAVTNLNNTLVSNDNVIANLKTSRAYIDLITDDMSPIKYSKDWGTDITKRKYNAQMELIKQAEILLAGSLIYRHMADDRLMNATSGVAISLQTIPVPSGNSSSATSISVGQTSVASDTGSADYDKNVLDYYTYLDDRQIKLGEYQYKRYMREYDVFSKVADKYTSDADKILTTFKPTAINFRYGDDAYKSKFINPTDIYNFALTNVSTESSFVLNTASLTGLGPNFNASGLILTAAAMVNNPVDGVSGVAVNPLESQTTLVDSKLSINGINYFLDDWVDSDSVTQAGVGAIGSSGGYSLDFTSVGGVTIEWNYNAAAGGFDLVSGDIATLTYYTI